MSDLSADQSVREDFSPTMRLRLFKTVTPALPAARADDFYGQHEYLVLQQWWERVWWPRDGREVEEGVWRNVEVVERE